MSKKDKALKLALEALKSVADHRPNDETNAAISAIREALAEQPAQPIKQGWDVDTLLNKPKQPAQQQEPVADSKAPMLADWLQANYEADEIDEAAEELRRLFRENQLLWKEREEPHQQLEFYIRECNRLESERDAALTKQQEPVAKVDYKQRDGFRWLNYLGWQRIPDGASLYTSPPASKPWVGLTEEEIDKLCPQFEDHMRREMWIIGFKAAHNAKENT